MLLVSVLLLAGFNVLDAYLFRIDKDYPPPPDPTPDSGLKVYGWLNVALLGGVMLAVLVSGVWKPGVSATFQHVTVELQNVVRDVLLLAIAWASWRHTNREYRIQNGFAWGPIIEVAKLFAGIFVTIIPVIAILRAGTAGAFVPSCASSPTRRASRSRRCTSG